MPSPPAPEPDERPTRKRRTVEKSFVAWLLATLRRKPVHGLATPWRLIFFAVLGTTVGTLLDAVHVWTKTAGYAGVAKVPVLEVAWYVPPEFALAGVVVGMLRPEFDEELRRKRSDLPAWKVLAGMVLLVVVWGASALFGLWGMGNVTITAVLLPVGAAGWYAFDRTKQGVIAALLTALLGVGVESALTYTGSYYYTRPDFIGVPVWLPVVYVTACGAVGNLGRFLKYTWDKPPGGQREVSERPAKAA